jgi:hypothetical protein
MVGVDPGAVRRVQLGEWEGDYLAVGLADGDAGGVAFEELA